MNNFNNSGFLFTYGLLQPSFNNQYSKLVTENFELMGEGQTSGHLYEINGYPGLVFDNSSNRLVFGTVWKIKTTRILNQLDRFEGIGPEFQKPYEYRREIIPVKTGSSQINCWAYIYNWTVRKENKIVSGNYQKYCSIQKRS